MARLRGTIGFVEWVGRCCECRDESFRGLNVRVAAKEKKIAIMGGGYFFFFSLS